MPRLMPPLVGLLGVAVDGALALAEVAEALRAAAPVGSAAWRELTPRRVEALYEMAYLRLFIAWESFLEESFVRFICGYRAEAGQPGLRQAAFPRIEDARLAILGGQDFVSWASPVAVEQRARQYMQDSWHEEVLQAARVRLRYLVAVRNRIAHGSDYARSQFDYSTMQLAARRFRGSAPGAFLRSWNAGAVPQERWLSTIGNELKSLSVQIVP
jgi:hypothetical protein